MKFVFACGCNIDKLDFSNIPLDCPATWDMISNGLTKGVFQLEKVLGRRWAKKIKPRSIEQLSDLISLIRPGCLEAKYREKEAGTDKWYSITETYEKIKNGQLQPEYIHPVLEKILAPTHGCLIYQEQIMSIATEFAGYSFLDADNLRKIVGKKLPDKMIKEKDKFIAKAKEKGHDEYTITAIWNWIVGFADYGFNKSHGVGYALAGYRSAYAKCHFPLAFFKAMLTNSESKQDELEEIKELVNEAKLWNIKVTPPRLSLLNKDFEVVDGSIIFGLLHIKGVGATTFPSLKLIKDCKDYTSLMRKIFIEEVKVNSGAMEALIKAGALDNIYPNRINLIKLYKLLKCLTDREIKYIFELIDGGETFAKAIQSLLTSDVPNKGRVERIQSTINDIKNEFAGNPLKMKIGYEKYYLGMALSGSEVDVYKNPHVDTTCKNFLKLRDKTKCTLGVIIEGIRKHKDKNGNIMAFLQVSDNTYMLDGIVIFAKKYNDFGWIIEEGKPICMSGRKDGESFLVDKIEHL